MPLTFLNNATFSANVGIGTTSPRGRLDVVGNTDDDTDFLTIQDNDPSEGSHRPCIRFRSNTAQIGTIIGLNGRIRFSSGTGEDSMLEILDNGNVGIGTTAPGDKLEVDGTGAFGDATTYSLKLQSSTGSRGIKLLDSNGTARGGIDWNSGDFLIRNASDQELFKVNYSTKNATLTGTITATNFILSSDKRLKENIKEACGNTIKTNWKTFELKTEKGQRRYGVIAQELEKTNPEFVREDSKGFKSVAYIDLLIAKIAELEARLDKANI